MQSLIPWQWRKLSLNNRTGSEIFESLFLKTNSICTLLESPHQASQIYPTSLSRYSICAGNPRFINSKHQLWTPSIGNILNCLKALLDKTNSQIINIENSQLPFTGGWLGWLGYDLAWEIERLPYLKSDVLPFPVAYWYEPENFAILDHHQQILWLATTEIEELDRLELLLNQNPSILSKINSNPHQLDITFLSNQTDYENAVKQALKYIQAGDIFQANLSLRFAAITKAKSWSIYRTLQQINPSPFASYWQTPWGNIISCSPERLIKLVDKQAETRPIAGTRSRNDSAEIDQQLALELLTNIKERAEHIMLVDLERNDLGRVCEWGSVKVDELLTIERYSHVMHLVSNIKGTLKDNFNSIDLIKAVFPGGTITGCPKVRCLEIIEELEPFRRSLFYGSCGYLDQRGNLDLNILIRTLLCQPNHDFKSLKVWGQVGAGIVADSEPEKEWYESLNKAEAQLVALRKCH